MSPLPAGSSISAAPLVDLAPDVVVVIPARDEEARIEACLAALIAQRGIGEARVKILLIADGCVDETEARAVAVAGSHRASVTILSTPARGVGPSRRLGMELAARMLSSGGIIMSTDGDSQVAPDWMAATFRAVAHAAQVVAGDVRLDREESSQLHLAALEARQVSVEARLKDARRRRLPHGTVLDHGHFAGSSLAITRELYIATGGMPSVATLEDVALHERLSSFGIPTVRSALVSVSTSARVDSRARGGLGDRLRGAPSGNPEHD